MKKSIVICMLSALIGCSPTDTKQTSDSSKIKENSKTALKECGKGGVESVSVEGFFCKSTEK